MEAVTKLISLLDKPALMKWANKIGLQGISLEEYRKSLADKGTKKHDEIENYLKNGVEFKESYKLVEILKDYKIVGVEKSINNGFITGRYDLLIEKDNELTVVDFKSNGKIYLSHKIQLSTYKEILNADHIAIINFEKWELNKIKIDSKKYYKIIKHLYVIKQQINQLNERL